MLEDFTFAHRPRSWDLVPAPAPGTGATLRLGEKRVAVSDIADVVLEERAELDTGGLIVVAAGFALFALVLFVGVMAFEWRTRFLIGAVFLAAIALTGVADIWSVKPIRSWRLKVVTRAGEEVVFTSAERGEIEALVATLAAA